jgi:signal transduction histidine kinase
MARLQTYLWPGNIVELEAVLNRTLVHLPDESEGGRSIGVDELLFSADDVGRARLTAGASRPGVLATLARLPVRAVAPAAAPSAAEALASQAVPTIEPAPATNVDLRRVVAGLAHDLRNPMTAIKTFAGTLAALPADEDARRLGDLAGEACTRIDGYLEALQRFGDLGTPEPRIGDLVTMLREAIEGLSAADGERVDVAVTEPMQARVDAAQMVFAFENVLAGMLAESAPDGRVRVTAESHNELVFEARVGRGPIGKLRALLDDGDHAMSWRLLLAGAACERNGFEVDEAVAGDTVRVRCRPAHGEVETRDEQTHRTGR